MNLSDEVVLPFASKAKSFTRTKVKWEMDATSIAPISDLSDLKLTMLTQRMQMRPEKKTALHKASDPCASKSVV